MADKAHIKTDEKLEQMERRLSAIYSRAEKEIKKTADDYFLQFKEQDKAKLELLEQGKITEKEYKKWRTGKIMVGKRYEELKQQIANSLLHVNEIATAYINGELPEVYALNYNQFANNEIKGYSFTLTDANTVKNLSLEDKSLLPYRKLDPKKDIRWNMKKINSEVLQGILQGDSIPEIAKRMTHVEQMNKDAAVRTARTIVTSAECKGRQDSYIKAQKDGIVLEREWVSAHDSRTREWHSELNGKKVGIDEPFVNSIGKIMYPGDPTADGANVYNCRCTIVAVIEGFKKNSIVEATKEQQGREITIAKTRSEAYKELTEDIGFAEVGKPLQYIDDKTIIETANRLKELNSKFHAIKGDYTGYITAVNSKGFVAETTGDFRNPNNQNLRLSLDSYSHGNDFIIKEVKKSVLDGWSMPCSKTNYSIYTITHEYGHIIENFVINQRYNAEDFDARYKKSMGNFTPADLKRSKNVLKKESDKYAKEIFNEIIEIAKAENPDFSLRSNISNYGKSNYQEAFAETFANSQCGEPNDLGKAMIKWLETNLKWKLI